MMGYPGPAGISRRERLARAAAGMPARHPELITRKPGRAEWKQLTTWMAEMWPDDDHAAIFTSESGSIPQERESDD